MQIKILCPCGTKFAFEVEPIGGRMPVRVQCPECNADATELANAVIAEQLSPTPGGPPASAPQPPEAPRVRIRASVPKPPETAAPPPPPPPPPVAEPAQPRLRVAGSDDAAPPPAPAAGDVEFCSHHPTNRATEHCRVCGKPICPQCMELFGYVCSVYCRSKAEREKLALPRYAQQRSVIADAARAKARLAMVAVAAVAVLLLGGWIWWTFFGTRPHVVYSLPIPKAERGTIYEMLSPTEVLAVKERQLTLLDITTGKEVWTTALEGAKSVASAEVTSAKTREALKPTSGPTPELAAGKLAGDAAQAAAGQAKPEAEESDEDDDWIFRSYDAPTLLTISGGNIWLQFPDRLAAYDRQIGVRKQEVPLSQPLLNLEHSDSGIVALSGDERSFRTVTWITLPAGTVKSEQVAPAQNINPGQAHTAANARAFAAALGVNDLDLAEFEPVGARHEFLPGGAAVVEYQTKLVEKKTVWREAMKPKPEKSIVDSGRLSAGQSLEAVQELMNEMKRSDGGDKIEEDVSRYEVTLHRLLGASAPVWSGEVIGPPSFFPLKTVDVVCGAKQVIVLDKANKKRWQATNIFNLDHGFSLGRKDEKHFPCVESADALYVFDQGMLTCFELATGQARWRLTSVGISRVQLDGEGRLYVNTTTASPDVIDFPKQVNIFEKTRPVILKVDAATGKVLWKVDNIADECILSGKYVYAARSSSGLYGSGTHFNLYRLDPVKGEELWNYYQERWPRNTGYHGNQFMLQWKDEVQVLKFLTL